MTIRMYWPNYSPNFHSWVFRPTMCFLCRPTLGNETYSIPVEKGYEIFEKGANTFALA